MNIIVTGGAGFIGSAVIRHFINHTAHNVINIDKLTYAGNLESLESVENHSRYTFEKVDICNKDEIIIFSYTKWIFCRYQPRRFIHFQSMSY